MSLLQEGANTLPTPDAMRGWSSTDVQKWALTISILPVHANILLDNFITGEDLLEHVTTADLLAVKMPLGPAGRIMSVLAAIKSVEAAVPSSMGESTGANRGCMSVVLSEGTIMAA